MIAMTETTYQKWIKALRSGRYRQVKAALRMKNPEGELEYCCLGVLCDVHGLKWTRPMECTVVGGTTTEYAIDMSEHVDKANNSAGECTYGVLPGHFKPKNAESFEDWNDEGADGNFDGSGIKYPEGFPENAKGIRSLTALNDDTDLSFKQIADFIELNKDQIVEIVK